MDAVVRNHLPVIVVVTLVGVITGCVALTFVHNSASTMDANLFSGLLFVVPCAIMLVCSFVIAFTAYEIGRQLYIVVLSICLILGVVSMLVGSAWLSDQSIAAQLLANSPADTVITPILKSPMTILRDIAAFVVVPTVGCILGAWAGSRVHPMRADKKSKKSNKSKQGKR